MVSFDFRHMLNDFFSQLGSIGRSTGFSLSTFIADASLTHTLPDAYSEKFQIRPSTNDDYIIRTHTKTRINLWPILRPSLKLSHSKVINYMVVRLFHSISVRFSTIQVARARELHQ